MTADRVYRALLLAYPAGFRERFAEGMRFTFASELRESRRKGRAALTLFCLRTAAHAVAFGLGERLREIGRDRREIRRIRNTKYGEGKGELMTDTGQEIRHALRRLVKSPGFTLAAIATLALGIGATTAIFSVLDGVVLKSLPYPEDDELVIVGHKAAHHHGNRLGAPDGVYFHYSENAKTLSAFALYLEVSVPISGAGEPREIGIIEATPSLFSVLGVAAEHGRVFTEEEGHPGAADVCLLTHELWQSRYGGDPAAIGGTITVAGSTYEIVGVLPAGFEFIRPRATVTFGNKFDAPGLLVPLHLDRAKARFGNFIYQAIGRLAPGATVDDARREISVLMQQMPRAYPGGLTDRDVEEKGWTAVVEPFKKELVGDVARVLWIMFGAVGFVLLIAAANVANLFLVRTESKRQEIALRRALGASSGGLARAFLCESAVLAVAGGGLGLALAQLGTRVLLRLAPPGVPRLGEVAVNGPVLAFTAALAVLTGLAFGGLPLLRYSRLNVAAAVGGASRGASAGRERHRARQALIAAQVAFALVLLMGSTLLVRTFRNLNAVDAGFGGSDALTFKVSPSLDEYPSAAARTQFFLELTEKLEALPGVEMASFGSDLPLDGNNWRDSIAPEDAPREPGVLPLSALRHFVGPGYLRALGARLLRGRELERRDFAVQPDVVVVNQSFAEQRWPGQDPIGKRIAQWPETVDAWYTVVGVVADVREVRLTLASEPTVYLPTVFLPGSSFSMFVRNLTVLVKTSGDPLAVLPAVRREVHALHPETPITSVRTLGDLRAASTQQVSFAMVLLTIAAAVALLLGMVGIYGVVAYVVGRRTREIGVRMALGAQARQVAFLVVCQGALAGAAGVALGIAGAALLSRFLDSLLFGVTATDVATYAAVAAGILAVVVAASFVPARRAMAVDPVEALRTE